MKLLIRLTDTRSIIDFGQIAHRRQGFNTNVDRFLHLLMLHHINNVKRSQVAADVALNNVFIAIILDF
ncbi:hypothetical protein D3C78_1227730 [compost metagenome]